MNDSLATRRNWKAPLAAGLALAGGLLLGLVASDQPLARADVRETTPRQGFQSGAQRSEAVLREIAATLKRIDARLERMERLATQK